MIKIEEKMSENDELAEKKLKKTETDQRKMTKDNT
jgi:hypothetical protein